MSNNIEFKSPYTTTNRIKRMLWSICWTVLARPFPKSLANTWKVFILRCFGAKIAKNAYVYSSANIFMPWNLIMEENSCLASGVDCYNAAPVIIKKYATVSQRAYLCTASHNISSSKHEQTEKPSIRESRAWVAAEAFVGPGVTIGDNTIIGAGSVVTKDIPSNVIAVGNPCKVIKSI